MHHARVAEHHERVAVGVRRAEVVEVDRVVAAEQRQLVLEGAVRQAVLVGGSWNTGIFCMLAAVFSCATISTVAGKNSLLPVWSPWVCVLMMCVTACR